MEMKIKDKNISRKRSKKYNRIQRLGKIVLKQISWRLAAVLSKVCLEYDLSEFTDFVFYKFFNGAPLKVIPGG